MTDHVGELLEQVDAEISPNNLEGKMEDSSWYFISSFGENEGKYCFLQELKIQPKFNSPIIALLLYEFPEVQRAGMFSNRVSALKNTSAR